MTREAMRQKRTCSLAQFRTSYGTTLVYKDGRRRGGERRGTAKARPRREIRVAVGGRVQTSNVQHEILYTPPGMSQ